MHDFQLQFGMHSYNLWIYIFYLQIIISSCYSQSTESSSSTLSSVIANNTLTSTSSTSSMSSSTSRHKYVPSVSPSPKVKKRGSSHAGDTTSTTAKVKKNAHAGNVQNVNSSREALNQEGSDQQVSVKTINFN